MCPALKRQRVRLHLGPHSTMSALRQAPLILELREQAVAKTTHQCAEARGGVVAGGGGVGQGCCSTRPHAPPTAVQVQALQPVQRPPPQKTHLTPSATR